MDQQRKELLIILLSVAVITFISFLPSLSNGWTSWDDTMYVTENPYITEISPSTIGTVFTHVLDGSYVPLTMVSYMIDYSIGGYDAKVYHATNLLLHLCNTLLVVILIRQLSGNVTAALVAGILFGIHPMRVESVAWISGRKDVLSMFFFLLSSIMYLSYVDTKKNSFLTLSFMLFVCALFSKTIVLTFPLILFLYDHYRGRTFSIRQVNEKFAFILASLAMSVIGFFGQESVHTVKKSVGVVEHSVVAMHGPVFYLEKFFLPVNLSNLYTYPSKITLSFYLYAVLFIALAAIVWKLRKNKTVLFGMLFFLLSLLPVMQIIKFSSVFAADRFTYIPYIGLFFIVGTVAARWWDNGNRKILLVGFSLVILAFSYGTWRRCEVWKDNSTLWKDMLSKYPSPMEQ